MKKIKCFERTRLYASVLCVILIVAFFSGSVNSLTLCFGDDPDTPDQDSHFGVLFTNQSGDDYFLYGHNATTEDLLLYGNNVDGYSYVRIDGNGNIYLDSYNDLQFLVNGTQTLTLGLSGDDAILESVADIIFNEGAAQMIKFQVVGTNTIVRGGSDAGDDISIYASVDSHPVINLTGNDDITLDAADDIIFYDNGQQMFQFSRAATLSYIYSYAADRPYIKFYDSGSVYIDMSEEFKISDDGATVFKVDISGVNSLLYGGDASGDDIHIFTNSVSNSPAIYMNDTGGVKITDLVLATAAPRNPVDGSVYFVTGNQSIAVYYNSIWRYYETT